MNVSDAEALLGVHIQTPRSLAGQKKVPAFKVGRDWRFRKEALLRWTDEQGKKVDAVSANARCSLSTTRRRSAGR